MRTVRRRGLVARGSAPKDAEKEGNSSDARLTWMKAFRWIGLVVASAVIGGVVSHGIDFAWRSHASVTRVHYVDPLAGSVLRPGYTAIETVNADCLPDSIASQAATARRCFTDGPPDPDKVLDPCYGDDYTSVVFACPVAPGSHDVRLVHLRSTYPDDDLANPSPDQSRPWSFELTHSAVYCDYVDGAAPAVAGTYAVYECFKATEQVGWAVDVPTTPDGGEWTVDIAWNGSDSMHRVGIADAYL
jgi:hypothetical protein